MAAKIFSHRVIRKKSNSKLCNEQIRLSLQKKSPFPVFRSKMVFRFLVMCLMIVYYKQGILSLTIMQLLVISYTNSFSYVLSYGKRGVEDDPSRII